MVRQQEAEEMATIAHLRPLFNRLRVLGGDDVAGDGSGSTGGAGDDDDDDSPTPALPSLLRGRIDDEGNVDGTSSEKLSYPALGGGDGGQAERLGHLELDNLLSFDAMTRAYGILEQSSETEEVMTTDKQLMMVLRTITEHYVPGGEDSANASFEGTDGKDDDDDDDDDVRKKAISFPEFLHAYKTVVTGMLVMQMLPSSSDDNDESRRESIIYHRNRTRDRALTMLRTFNASGTTTDGDGNNNQISSPSNVSTDQIRKMLTLKDRQLVRLVESHMGEIDDIADVLNKVKWYKRTWGLVAAAATAVIFVGVVGGVLSLGLRREPTLSHLPAFEKSRSLSASLDDTVSIPKSHYQRIAKDREELIDTKKTLETTESELSQLRKKELNCLSQIQILKKTMEATSATDQALLSKERKELATLKQTHESILTTLSQLRKKESTCLTKLTQLTKSHDDVTKKFTKRDEACAVAETTLASLEQQTKLSDTIVKATEAAKEHCQNHLKYMEADLALLKEAEETKDAQLQICERNHQQVQAQMQMQIHQKSVRGNASVKGSGRRGGLKGQGNDDDKAMGNIRAHAMRKYVLSAAIGCGLTILVPKLAMGVGVLLRVIGAFFAK